MVIWSEEKKKFSYIVFIIKYNLFAIYTQQLILPEKKESFSGIISHTAYIYNKDDKVSPSVPLALWNSSILWL